MRQFKFTLENEAETQTRIPIPEEQAQKLIELMAQAILARLQQPPGEEDEHT